jgi:release factor glutamine methyltransferase
MNATAESVVLRLRAAGCVFAEDEAALLLAESDDADRLERMVAARVAGRPLEHVLGWVAFRGRRVVVEDRVFVPRRRTELLVDAALPRLRNGSVVVELCCGAAAVGAALLAEASDPIEVWASDIDLAAVDSARRNLESLGGRVVHGDLFEGLPGTLAGRVDLLIANAPYVPTASIATMPPEAREHEAVIALDGGADGLDVQRRIIAQAADWLAPSGTVLIETSERQAPATSGLMRAAGLTASIVRDDDLDGTVVVGVLA